MIDPHTLELAGTAAGLAATYCTEVARGKSDNSTKDFRAWLENVAFPALLKNAEQTLATVISLKAADTERYGTLLSHLLAIREAVGASGPKDIWGRLSALDRALLTQLYNEAREDLDIDIESTAIAPGAEVDVEDIYRSARYLNEQGLILRRDGSSRLSIGPTPQGISLAWEVLAPEESAQAISRLRDVLKRAEVIRLGQLSADADVPLGLTTAQVRVWQRESLVTFADNYAPFEAGLVEISEAFRRMQ